MKLTLPTSAISPLEADEHADRMPLSGFSWNRILVAVDLTPAGRTALHHAAELAQWHGARLTLLHVVVAPSFMSGLEDSPLCKSTGEVLAEARVRLENWASAAGGLLRDSERVVRVGQPHREIVALAAEQDADVIVLAEEPMNWLERLLLGSVTAKVKRRAPCPVLTLAVPRKAKARSSPAKVAPEEAWRIPASGPARLRPRASTT